MKHMAVLCDSTYRNGTVADHRFTLDGNAFRAVVTLSDPAGNSQTNLTTYRITR